jgi:hypothetical protein
MNRIIGKIHGGLSENVGEVEEVPERFKIVAG